MMKQILAASFLLIALAACDKKDETTVRCYQCSRFLYTTDDNGHVTESYEEHDICGLNEQDKVNYEHRNTGRQLLNVYYGDLTCTVKDSI